MTDQQLRSGAGATAPVVLGFSTTDRTWMTEGEHTPPTSHVRLPPLDGALVVDPEVCREVATDLGRIVHRQPSAVLRPGSSEDVAAMLRFCREHGIGVSVRGQAHTTFGQGLSNGVVIENRFLDRIHDIRTDSVEVDAGVTWKQLTMATVREGKTAPVLTGYTNLTIGGTLSVGGIGGLVGGLHTGLQVDHVRELEVVTGTGERVRCSAERNSDLFEAVLGGLGRFGVITRAVLDLVPAPSRARTYTCQYDSTATFFRDLRAMITRPGVNHVYGEVFRTEDGLSYLLHATAFYDPPAAPDDSTLTAGLASTPTVADRDYLHHVFSIDDAIDGLIAEVEWNQMVKPWFDVWLPGSTVEACVDEITRSLEPVDIGPYGAGLIYPQRRAFTGMPTPALPLPDGSEWVFVLDVNTVSATKEPDPGFAEQMLERNRQMYVRARDAHGARLYPIGSVPFTTADWQDHYGAMWEVVRRNRRRFDPDGILVSGNALTS